MPSGGEAVGVGSVRRVVADYGALVSSPSVVTAPADVVAGVALATVLGASVPASTVVCLCLASAFVYAAGTMFDSVADATAEAVDRPCLSVPSGRVDGADALSVGAALLVGGVVLATAVGGAAPGLTAVVLALAVLLSDAFPAGSPADVRAVATARGSTVVLGLSVAGAAAFAPLALLFPAAVAVSAGALTRMAEAGGDGTVAAAATVTVTAMVVAVVATLLGTTATGLAATVVAAGSLAWDWRTLGPAIADPTSENVGSAADACVVGGVFLDAAVAVVAGPLFAVAAAGLVVPAAALSRNVGRR